MLPSLLVRLALVLLLTLSPAAAPLAGTAPQAAAAPVPAAAARTGPVLPTPSGAFGWPLAGQPTVTRWFEPPPHPYGRGHRGVDLAAGPGATVHAAGAGTVVFAAPLAGRGVVSVDHPGGLRTTYEPVHAQVSAGDTVTRGQPLGVLTAGHAGCPAAACLHWGLRRGADYLDPLRLLAPARVRLLPWTG